MLALHPEIIRILGNKEYRETDKTPPPPGENYNKPINKVTRNTPSPNKKYYYAHVRRVRRGGLLEVRLK